MAAVLRGKEAPAELSDTLAARLDGLVSERIVYFPIRHHSPACAWHLERLMRARKARAILIEGPASLTPLIPLILHAKTKAPFAVYTSFVEEENSADEAKMARPSALFGPARHAAYYPLCDYSPELVALRVGQELGATLRFIDLDYPEQVRAESPGLTAESAPRVESLLAERHFQRSRYLQALARRAGCRDHNDLWDHLFETRFGCGEPVESFIRDVAAWCHFARGDASVEELDADGTGAREATMAAAIRDELSKGTEPIIVVTGGFHTVALPDLAAAKPPAPRGSVQKEDAIVCLVRYGFEQLDALNGYAAGMPSPYYYDQLWHSSRNGEEEPFAAVAAKVLVDLGQLTRRKKLALALSPADEIAALEQARRLAGLRGHPGPTREDLLDGIRSCFVKGAMDAEGQVVIGLAHHTLGGTRVGEVPAEAGAPPIVDDFRSMARNFRINISDSVRRKTSLDLYRKSGHRRSSRFLHSLTFLEVPFASMTAGPDFVKGVALERLHEHWEYQWTPQVESRLIEASVLGATVEEAAANRLARAVVELEETGRGRSAAEAVRMLVHACRMGLHRQTGRLLVLIEAEVIEDPAFTSLAAALNQLVLLWESREPLEAHRLPQIPRLICAAYERACYLLHHLADTPEEAAEEVLRALGVVREILRTGAAGANELDANLFAEPLLTAIAQPRCPPLLAGGAAGLLHGDGRLTEGELLKLLSGALSAATSQTAKQVGFLIGLLRTCRELAWRQPALVAAVEQLLSAWSEEEFIERIPHLRMAFADLTPKETDQVAAVVAQFHSGQRPDALHDFQLSEADVLMGLRVNAAVKKSLIEDGLGAWVESEEARPPGPRVSPIAKKGTTNEHQ